MAYTVQDRLLLMTHRKSHTGFSLVPKSVTLTLFCYFTKLRRSDC